MKAGWRVKERCERSRPIVHHGTFRVRSVNATVRESQRLEEEVFSESESMSADVTEALHGVRLDAAAASLFSDFSRSRLSEWIKSGRLRRNGEVSKPRDKVAVGDALILTPEYDDRVEWGPEPLPLDILYEDEHVIVLNKPVGLVVHPAAGHHSGTLVNGLLAHAPDMAALPRGGSCTDWIKTPRASCLRRAHSLPTNHWLPSSRIGASVAATRQCAGVLLQGVARLMARLVDTPPPGPRWRWYQMAGPL